MMAGDDRAARRLAREARLAEEQEEDEPTPAVTRVVVAPAPKKQRRGQPSQPTKEVQRVRSTGARFFEVAENAALCSELVALSHAADIANLVATSKRAYVAWQSACAALVRAKHGVVVAWGPEEVAWSLLKRGDVESYPETPLELVRFFEVREEATQRRGASFAAFSARHSIFLEDGFAYACGRADEGRCGLAEEALGHCQSGGSNGALVSPTPLRLDTRGSFEEDDEEQDSDEEDLFLTCRKKERVDEEGTPTTLRRSTRTQGTLQKHASSMKKKPKKKKTISRALALGNNSNRGESRVVACAAGAGHTIVLSALGVASCCGRGAPSPTSRGGGSSRSSSSSSSSSWSRRGERLSSSSSCSLEQGIASVPRALGLLRARVVYASASANHALFVTAAGLALSSGVGAFGRLGHGDEVDRQTPRVIEALRDQRVIAVAAGAAHSLFATRDGEAFSCGQGEDGRLGLGPPTANEDSDDEENDELDGHRMRLRSSNPSAAAAAASAAAAAVIEPTQSRRDSSTAAYSTDHLNRPRRGPPVNEEKSSASPSRRRVGRLLINGGGLPRGRTTDRAGDVLKPRLVNPTQFSEYGTVGAEVSEVVAGAHHSVFVTRNGRAFSCGFNSSGQLGHARQRSFNPELVTLPVAQQPHPLSAERRVEHVAAGYAHTLVVTRTGMVYAMGSNHKGALGLGDQGLSIAVRPTRTPQPGSPAALALGLVAQVAAGGFSSAFRSRDTDEVFVCGANADGQLGLGHYNDVTEPTLRPKLNNKKQATA